MPRTLPMELVTLVLKNLPFRSNVHGPLGECIELLSTVRLVSKSWKKEVERFHPRAANALAHQLALRLWELCTGEGGGKGRNLDELLNQLYYSPLYHLAELDLGECAGAYWGASLALRQILALCPQLRQITIGRHNQFDDAFIGNLELARICPHLFSFSLTSGGKSITSQGVARLAAVVALVDHLSLDHIDLSDDGLDLLGVAAATNLQTLSLERCSIGPAGAATVAELLSNGASRLKILDLVFNEIGEEGAAILAPALKRSTTLRELDVFANDLENSGLRVLDIGGTKLEIFNGGGNDVDELGVLNLAESNTLRELWMGGHQSHLPQLDIAALKLPDCLTLRSLSLSSSSIGDAGAAELGDQLPRARLTMLNAFECNITDVGLASLRLHLSPTLEEVDLAYNQSSTHEPSYQHNYSPARPHWHDTHPDHRRRCQHRLCSSDQTVLYGRR